MSLFVRSLNFAVFLYLMFVSCVCGWFDCCVALTYCGVCWLLLSCCGLAFCWFWLYVVWIHLTFCLFWLLSFVVFTFRCDCWFELGLVLSLLNFFGWFCCLHW